ncbi:MAG: hypothetical protein LBP86_03150 [Azoarcus sp.]|jgi:hypothetical protein|nr:hypothetical protein [Azoarcus sp.]
MTEKKATMPALDFARTYWRVAVNAACLDLMNDVPVLPDIVLNRYTEIPTLADEYAEDALRSVLIACENFTSLEDEALLNASCGAG